jgi:hypothetical protein
MEEIMVVTSVIIIMSSVVSLKIVRDIDNDAETIEVRKNAGQGDEATVARIIRGLGGNNPARQEMCDGSHAILK